MVLSRTESTRSTTAVDDQYECMCHSHAYPHADAHVDSHTYSNENAYSDAHPYSYTDEGRGNEDADGNAPDYRDLHADSDRLCAQFLQQIM